MTTLLMILDLYDDIRMATLSAGVYDGSTIYHNSQGIGSNTFLSVTIDIPKLADVSIRYENNVIKYNGFIVSKEIAKQRLIEIRENLEYLEEVSQ